MRFLVVVPAVLALIFATAARAESQRKCGTVAGSVALYDIRATNVTCKSARRTARAWRRTLFADECANGRFRCRVRGYVCRAKPPAEVHYPVTCTKERLRVRWEIHAD